MRKFLLYYILVSGTTLFIACKKDNLKSPEASFLVVPDPALSTTSPQGSNSEKITDVWLYVNEKFQGVYPIGGVMPVMASGSADIILYPGIKNNGIAATRIPYPFYNNVSFTQSLERGKTYTVNPVFSYISGLNFKLIDDFDSSLGSHFSSTGDSAYFISHDISKNYGGSPGSVFMSMTNAKPTAKMQTNVPLVLPSGGATVYLEMNYKCNQEITVGVIGFNTFTEIPILVVNKSDEWNKIYIQLTTALSTSPIYSKYDVYIKATKQSDVATPEIFIDNVKVIHLQ